MASRFHARVAATVIAAFVLLAGSPVDASGGWTKPHRFDGDCSAPAYSAVFDSAGGLHASATADCRSPGLWYFTAHTATRVVSGDRYGITPAIAIRARGGGTDVRIAWADPSDGTDLWLTRNDTGAWVSSRLWLGDAHDPAIAPWGPGVAVAFRDGSHRLRVLTWDPVTGPSAAAVVSGHCCAGLPSIAASAHGLGVAFSETATGSGAHRLRLATRTSGGWSLQTVDGHTTRDPSLAYTAGGVPVVAYEASHAGIWYARPGAASWHLRQVLGTGHHQAHIATDASGRVGVAATGVVFRRLDIASPAVTVAHASDLDTEDLLVPRLGFAAGHADITFSSFCACAGGGGGVWVTRQQ